MPYPRAKPPAGGIKANYPGFIEPSLATSIDRVPAGERWIHEIKFDGYRIQVHLRDAAVKVFTRRGNDWTNRFRKIAADAWHINARSAIIWRLSMARWWSRQRTAPRTSLYCGWHLSRQAQGQGLDLRRQGRPSPWLEKQFDEVAASPARLLGIEPVRDGLVVRH
jgi:ATP dependent DNA ligase domain